MRACHISNDTMPLETTAVEVKSKFDVEVAQKMTTSKSDDIEWWNELARKLDGYKSNYIVEFDGENGEQDFSGIVKELLKDYPTALDIGCADGAFAIELSSYAKKITAVDLSPVMIEAAKRSTAESEVEFIVADARHLPFPDNTFDLVISRRGPVSAPEFFEEAVRVTKPSGLIIEITIGETDAVELKQIFNRGQGYDRIHYSRYLEIRDRIDSNPLVRMRQMNEYFCNAIYPSLEDIVVLLSSTPIIDDFDVLNDKKYLTQIEQELTTSRGIYRTYHRIIWIAEKLRD